ncbi:MAG: hypothetical protein R3A10_00780 [Caldilineaceae bacterium]
MDGSDELVKELKSHVRHEVGPIAMPAEIEFVPSCPRPAAARSCGVCSRRKSWASRWATPARWKANSTSFCGASATPPSSKN